MILERIQKENDIKELSDEELKILASEIRQFLIEKISDTGGHLASNLGVIELTMALHLFLDLPKDSRSARKANVTALTRDTVPRPFRRDWGTRMRERLPGRITRWCR